MKNFTLKYIGLLFLGLIFNSCEEQDELSLSEFYDSLLIGNIELTVDKNVFFDGDPPVEFSARAWDDFETEVKNFDFVIISSEGDTLDGRTFKPDRTSRTTFRAIVNDIQSEVVTVDYVKTSEIDFIDLAYEGSQFLTTNSWSITGDFILTTIIDATVFSYDITKSNIPLKISNGVTTTQRSGLKFDEPGSFEVFAEFNGVKSESISFEVRAEKEYDEIELPIVYHSINFSPLVREVNRALESYNNIFSNGNIVLAGNDLTNQWENPNWVSAQMKFTLATEDEDGNTLENPGIHFVNTRNITNEEELMDVIKENIWNPNEYINIFLTDDFEYIDATRPFLTGARLDGLQSRGFDDGSFSDVIQFISNGTNPYNSITMGKFWGLYKTFECNEDFCDDTFNYKVDQKFKEFCRNAAGQLFDCRGLVNSGGLYFQAKNCSGSNEGQLFSIKNIMDDDIDDGDADTTEGGTELTSKRMREFITFDQRERMRVVIGNAPLRPTPFNN